MTPKEQIEISPLGVILLDEVVALGKIDPEPCPRCETGRKVKLDALGWVCSRCLESCVSAVVQSQDLKLIEDRETRTRTVYELILELYREVEAVGMLTQTVHYLQRILAKKEEARVAEHNPSPITKHTMRDS